DTEVGPDGDRVPVRIEVETDYPFEETVRLRVTAGPDGAGSPARFPLRLRLPQWCIDPELTLDEQELELHDRGDGHHEILRDWARTSILELRLPMRARITRRERQATAVHLGPLTMVASPGETWHEVPDAPGLGEWQIFPRTTWNWALADLDSAGSWPVHRGEVPEAPFALGRETVLHVPGCEVPQWLRDGDSASPPPFSALYDTLHSLDLCL